MLKKIVITIISLLILNIGYVMAEIKDCNEYNKLSKEFLKCQKENLKSKTDKTTIGKGINKFKSSKTLSDLLKKNWENVFW